MFRSRFSLFVEMFIIYHHTLSLSLSLCLSVFAFQISFYLLTSIESSKSHLKSDIQGCTCFDLKKIDRTDTTIV